MKPALRGVACLRPPREQVDYSQAQLGSAPSQDLALQLLDQLLLLRVASIFLASSDSLYLELHFPSSASSWKLLQTITSADVRAEVDLPWDFRELQSRVSLLFGYGVSVLPDIRR